MGPRFAKPIDNILARFHYLTTTTTKPARDEWLNNT